MQEQLLEQLCEAAASFYERGYAFGATGNISIREGDEIRITPTGKALKGLSPPLLARLDLAGNARNDNRPSKELPFHLAIYRARAEVGAIVHLHSTYAVALSCLDDLDETE
ncbi:MAG: class II aldolase/adducin family protein, partial [Pyrinomonadaceae bacterium]